MPRFVFIGDEVAAAGWRLARVHARATVPGAASDPLAPPQGDAQLVVLAADAAARIPEAQLRAALCRVTPVTVVVPDLREAIPYPDVAARMKRQLGIES